MLKKTRRIHKNHDSENHWFCVNSPCLARRKARHGQEKSTPINRENAPFRELACESAFFCWFAGTTPDWCRSTRGVSVKSVCHHHHALQLQESYHLSQNDYITAPDVWTINLGVLIREVLHGVGADRVGVKFPMFAVNCSRFPLPSEERQRKTRKKKSKEKIKEKRKSEKQKKERKNSSDPIYTNPIENLPSNVKITSQKLSWNYFWAS